METDLELPDPPVRASKLLMVTATTRPQGADAEEDQEPGYCLGVRFCDVDGVARVERLLVEAGPRPVPDLPGTATPRGAAGTGVHRLGGPGPAHPGRLAEVARADGVLHLMSELTICNFCSYERYQREARARGAEVTLFVDEELDMLGVRASDREQPLAWFLELSDHCVC